MPGERRNLRSSKDSTSSTNGGKSRSDSQTSSSKDKPPARVASAKGKASTAKKAAPSKEASKANGAPLENGANGAKDVEMADGSKNNGDEEMTVVVPAPKSSKLSADPGQDKEGDIDMNGSTSDEDNDAAEKIDPKVKTVQGQLQLKQILEYDLLTLAT